MPAFSSSQIDEAHLQAVFTPQPPSPAFAARLREQLRVEAQRQVSQKPAAARPRGPALWILAGLGGAVFLFGVVRALAGWLTSRAARLPAGGVKLVRKTA